MTLQSLRNYTSHAGKGLSLFGMAFFFLLSLQGLAGCRAQQPWPLWEAYTHRFLDDQGRVIDRSAGDRTTSEGQAYAMFFALVDNDRPHFDKLLNWTEANLANGDLTAQLPAWSWGRTESGQWKTRDSNTASDADLWMAYDLLEAGRLWRDQRYTNLGQAMAARIAREEVVLLPSGGTTLAPAPHGFHPGEAAYILNPSYLPLPVLTYFAHSVPQGPWGAVRDSLPLLLDSHMDHGFAMDWVRAASDGVQAIAPPHEPSAGERIPQAAGSYDAIRVYLWLGLSDPRTPGRAQLLKETSGMADLLRAGAASPPLEVSSLGAVVHADAPAGFSAAVIPYLSALGMKQQQAQQTARLGAAFNQTTGLYGTPGEYYDQNLALFSTAWSAQKFRFDAEGKLHLAWQSPRLS